MSAPAKLIGFAAALALLFGGGAIAGAQLGPDRSDEPPPAPHDAGHTPAPAPSPAGDGHGGHETPTGADQPAPVRGLGVSDGRLRVALATPEVRRGTPDRLRFSILRRDGRVVRDFDVEHTKRMHLIVVRRDLTGFQHLHPRQRADGSWSTPIRIDEAGSHRMFADFSHDGRASTLATDLRVDGAADLQALPAPAPLAISDELEVRLDGGEARAGREATLRFDVTRDGQPIHVEPYLGADGHLVALRDGDLAFLHVHPSEHGEDDGGHDDAIRFAATFPTEGRYRLFLQVRVDGRVHTVAYTVEVQR